MKPDEIHYYHLRIGHGVTLAFVMDTNGWVQFSYAICGHRDRYNKAFGRELAEERLFHPRQNKVGGFKVNLDAKRFDVLKAVVLTFLYGVFERHLYIRAPQWLRKLLSYLDSVDDIMGSVFPLKKEAA